MGRNAQRRRANGNHAQAPAADDVPKPFAEVVIRFREKLAHDQKREKTASLRVFRRAYCMAQGGLLIVNEVDGPLHWFHLNDVEEIEATPSKVEQAYGPLVETH